MSHQGKNRNGKYTQEVLYVVKETKTTEKSNEPQQYMEKKDAKFENQGHKAEQDRRPKQGYQQREKRDKYYNDKRDKYDEKPVAPPQQFKIQQSKPNKIDQDYRREQYSDEEQQKEEVFDIQKVKTKELTDVLTQLFKKNMAECPICYVRIHIEARIWNCNQCFSPYHLSCIQKWIKNTNAATGQVTYTWSCPKCNQIYNEELPDYYCFCGQERNPEFERYLIPHSCGSTCKKKRGKNCTHPCPMQCHPGPCPECNVKGISITCFCGKTNKTIQCSEDMKSFTCSQVCSRLLNCKKHQCSRQCHPGSCVACPIKENVECFCGSESVETSCGAQKFQCGRPCGKVLDCGKHLCESKQCHQSCAPCLTKPEVVFHCPCGKYTLEMILPQKRQSCLDPIPSCGTPFEKPLACGHKCRSVCGAPMPKCKQKVMQTCRCKSTQQLVECWEAQEKPECLCEKVCKKKKSCQVHKCGRDCCGASLGDDPQGIHLCLKVCNKPLACGNHNCGLFCHIGICQPCPIIITQPITCPCGKTTKNPPNRCGTKPPECHELCQKDLPGCDHKCQSNCHQDNCPACPLIIEKPCRCGFKQNVVSQCAKQAFCQTKCLRLLECGHTCQDVCPSPGPCSSVAVGHCNQNCGTKLLCSHPCPFICHFGKECPKEPCKTQVRVRCECGNRETYLDCGVVDEILEKTLKCDTKCANLKRFGNFINSSNKMVDNKRQVYYSPILMKFTHYNLAYLQKLENRLEDFLINQDNQSYNFQIGKAEWVDLKKNSLQILLSKHYKFDVQFQRLINGGYAFNAIKTSETVLPKVRLSEYFLQQQKGQFLRDNFPFEAKMKTLAPLIKTDIQQIESQITEYKEHYYLDKKQGTWEFYFWELQHAEEVQRRIKKIVGYSQIQWIIEANKQVLDERDKLTIKSQDEVIIKKPIKKTTQQYEDEDLQPQYTLQQLQELETLSDQFQLIASNPRMCNQHEIEERIHNEDLDIFEQDPFYLHQVRGRQDWMIQRFRRNGMNSVNEVEYLRTPKALTMTVDFIIQNVLDADKCLKFKQTLVNSIPVSPSYSQIYSYVCDRFAQVRAELNLLIQAGLKEYQHIQTMMVRFYCISAIEQIDLNENYTILSRLLADQFEQICDSQDFENNMDTICQMLLLQTLTQQDINNTISRLPEEIINNTQVLQACTNYKSKSIIPMFEFYKNIKDYRLGCILFSLLPNLRFEQTIKFNLSMLTMDLNEYTDLLAFDNPEQAIQYLESVGVNVTKTIDEQNVIKKLKSQEQKELEQPLKSDQEQKEEQKVQEVQQINESQQIDGIQQIDESQQVQEIQQVPPPQPLIYWGQQLKINKAVLDSEILNVLRNGRTRCELIIQ